MTQRTLVGEQYLESLTSLRNKGLVDYPTETIYSRDINPLEAGAIGKVYWARRKINKLPSILVFTY